MHPPSSIPHHRWAFQALTLFILFVMGFAIHILNTPGFVEFIERFGYIGIFLWFITIDQVTPIPEEISLLIVGYLCAHEVFHPLAAGLFCLAGFISADIAYYYLSRTGSKLIKRRPGKPRSSWMTSYREKLKTHMAKTVAILTFIPRMRMWAPILAGSSRLSFKKFLLFDSLALIAFTALYLSLGIIFNNSLGALMAKMKNLQHFIFFGFLLVAAVVIIVIERRRRKNTQAVSR
jgi:membrane protein DedA with SNARE-associated domain